jgi:hypothetical protein
MRAGRRGGRRSHDGNSLARRSGGTVGSRQAMAVLKPHAAVAVFVACIGLLDVLMDGAVRAESRVVSAWRVVSRMQVNSVSITVVRSLCAVPFSLTAACRRRPTSPLFSAMYHPYFPLSHPLAVIISTTWPAGRALGGSAYRNRRPPSAETVEAPWAGGPSAPARIDATARRGARDCSVTRLHEPCRFRRRPLDRRG